MAILSEIRGLTVAQRKVVVASFLGWTLDAPRFILCREVYHEPSH
jgi:hypothetical protein